MATAYNVFDSTVGSVVSDIVTKTLLSSDWAEITPTWSGVTLSASAGTTATTYSTTNTAGMYVGMMLKTTISSVDYYRRVTAIVANSSFTVSAYIGVAQSSGQVYTLGQRILKTTTTRGAQMVFAVSLAAGGSSDAYSNSVAFQFFRTHGGASISDFSDASSVRYVPFSTSTTPKALTDAVHAVLTAGKEHIFLTVEGPRNNEANTDSTSYGAIKNDMFMVDVVPYHAGDTQPCVAAYGRWANSSTGDPTTDTWVEVSRNAANNASWVPAKIATLSYFGTGGQTLGSRLQRTCSIDGNEYLWPYVVIQDGEGLRGRLNNIFNAGWNAYVGAAGGDTGEPIGDVLTYNSKDYVLVPVTKGGSTGGTQQYSPLGMPGMTTYTSSGYLSAIVAIPKT